MNKETLLKKLKHGHASFDKIIDQIIDNGLSDQIIISKWTIKDVLLHLSWYNTEVLTALQDQSLLSSDFWSRTIDDRNEMIFNKSAKEDLDIVRTKYNQSYKYLLQEIEKLSDTDLNSEKFLDFKLLENTGGPRKTFEFILGNSSPHHCEEHVDSLVERFDLHY